MQTELPQNEQIDKLLEVSKSNRELYRMKLEHDKSKLELANRVLYLGIFVGSLFFGSSLLSIVKIFL